MSFGTTPQPPSSSGLSGDAWNNLRRLTKVFSFYTDWMLSCLWGGMGIFGHHIRKRQTSYCLAESHTDQGLLSDDYRSVVRRGSSHQGAFVHHFLSKEDLAIAAAKYWSTVTGAFLAAAPYHALQDPCGPSA